MDWDQATRTWVDEGLIEAEQAGPLQAWLEQHASAQPGFPFADVALTGVVTLGTWLLTGSLVLAAALMDAPEELVAGVAVAAGLVQVVLGALARPTVGRAIAHGLWSAAVVVVVFGAWAWLEEALHPPDGLVLFLLPVVAVGVVGAVADRSSGLAAASAFVGAALVGTELLELDDAPFPEIVAATALVGTCVINGICRAWPTRFTAAQAVVPFVTFVACEALLIRDAMTPWMFGHGHDWWAWEAGTLLTFYGGVVLAAAAVGRSRISVVSGVGALMAAEGVLLATIGELLLTVVVLGLEGLALTVVAVVVVLVRAGKARRAASDQATSWGDS